MSLEEKKSYGTCLGTDENPIYFHDDIKEALKDLQEELQQEADDYSHNINQSQVDLVYYYLKEIFGEELLK